MLLGGSMSANDVGRRLMSMLIKQELFPAGSILLAACSGGADSLAMTDLLREASRVEGWRVFVCHVQHHLRDPEAEEDALFVEAFCRARNLPFLRSDIDVRSYAASERLSVEEAARLLRYKALEEKRLECGALAIITGHHQDDQAETVLLNLLRGTGTQGLRGMQQRNGFIVRPFLAATRSEFETYCRERGIIWRIDYTNDCLEHKRNRIRQELLPLLETYNPRIREALARTAQLAAKDQEFLCSLSADFLARNFKKTGEVCTLDVREFEALAVPIASRVLRGAFEAASLSGAGQLGSKHVEAMSGLILAGRSGASLHLPGLKATYAYGFLQFGGSKTVRKQMETGSFCAAVGIPGQVCLPDGRQLTAMAAFGEEPEAGPGRAVYPISLVAGIIEVRTRRNGDCFQTKNGSRQKLKKYLIDKKVPRAERDKLLLVCSGQDVLWLIDGKSAGWKKDRKFAEWLVLEVTKGGSRNA